MSGLEDSKKEVEDANLKWLNCTQQELFIFKGA